MSTLGREPARRAINAADIPDNSINASKIIDGTISAADVSSDLVTLTGSQTLTNKTLTTPALGTPSAINLANATFPAGKVINFEAKSAASTTSQAITTSWTDSEKGVVTYDVVSQTSKLFVQWNAHFQVENDATDYRMGGALRSDIDSYASNLSEGAGGAQPLSINYSSPQIYLWTQYTMPIIAWHDHNQSAGTTISYKVYFQGPGTVYSWDGWGRTVNENVTFIEVEQ